MGRAPCCDKANVKKGPWSPEEDAKLKSYIHQHGTAGNWIALPQKIGLKRCGKSCRLRWLNYLRPDIKHGGFSEEEDNIICSLYISIGSRWSIIAAHLPGRTDNDIKNYWNTRLKKKLLGKHRLQSAARRSTAGAGPSINQDLIKKETTTQQINPYWPELSLLRAPYPINEEPKYFSDDHETSSIRKFLAKLGESFSDHDHHDFADITNLDHYPLHDLSTTTSTQKFYDHYSMSNMTSSSSSASINGTAPELGHNQYSTDPHDGSAGSEILQREYKGVTTSIGSVRTFNHGETDQFISNTIIRVDEMELLQADGLVNERLMLKEDESNYGWGEMSSLFSTTSSSSSSYEGMLQQGGFAFSECFRYPEPL